MDNIMKTTLKYNVLTGLIATASLLTGCALSSSPILQSGLQPASQTVAQTVETIATGDLGVIVERATGSVQIVNTTSQTRLARISGLGDLSHASIVYSRDERFAYVFGRDGGLTKVDITKQQIDKRIMQAGNSIGGAISQDGKLVAVSNYTPGGVRIFDSETLELKFDLPAIGRDGKQSKTVGLVDAPGQQFVFSLFDSGEIWIVDLDSGKPIITKFFDIGQKPYDALMSPDGRYYIAGLFGEDGMAMLDLWHPEKGVTRILPNYGMGEKRLPVYKMPHLEGWAISGNRAFVPAVGRHEVLVLNMTTWEQEAAIPVHGQPIFVMARPDGRHVWVNFAYPDNDTLQVIETEKLKIIHEKKPGKAVLHMEFNPRGEKVWASVRDENKVCIYDTNTFVEEKCFQADSPSGIFFTNRAHIIGL
ncbi:Heme d1 biosynthesis protein NirF [Oleispira antarctica RB-8]|uniref:Heme d1 biosynthesis protein NirF n=1 Tax=Oleispira antarctica RB-8 TaxID=698738 RepID=R4YST2_OLEAN|nr:Heme d1 biosynthesis protein NirF [Oleispira antarctica RB-8]